MLLQKNIREWGVVEARALRQLALSTKITNFGHDLLCFAPSLIPYSIDQYNQCNESEFVSFSITGTRCQLHCEHCNATILSSMRPIASPEQLYDTVRGLVEIDGCKGILISGGANVNGEVPLAGYPEALRRLKEDFNIQCVVHSGLIQADIAYELIHAKVDAIMLDIIGDDQTIHDICHLNRKRADYEGTLRLLENLGIPTVPHIVVGLNYGQLAGEIAALDIVARYNPTALVLVVLMPIAGTRMEFVAPPSLRLVSRLLTLARLTLPKTPILLGCARPGGEYKQKLDISAIRSGINGIAYPCQEAVDYASQHGFQPTFSGCCCSLAYTHFIPPVRGKWRE